MTNTSQRIKSAISSGLPKARKTIIWLIKLILPISLGVQLLQYSGLLDYVAVVLNPVFKAVGLPGASAIAFVCSLFLPLYAPAAIISTMTLTVKQISILAIMCLISHNLIVESAVQKKTGSSFIFMYLMRFAMSFVAAFIWNILIPDNPGNIVTGISGSAETISFIQMLQNWAIGAVQLVIKMVLIVSGLMILQRLLEEFKIMGKLASVFAPLMKFMGLSGNSSFLWIIGNVVGLTYGSAIMIEQVNEKKISLGEASMLNNHLAICHSLLEDSLLFIAIGASVFWVTVPRLLLAVAVVWIFRLYLKIRKGKSLAF